MKKQFLILVCTFAQLLNLQSSYASGGNGVVIGNGGGKKQDSTSAFMSKTMFNFQNVQADVLQEPYNSTGDPIIISNPKKRDHTIFLIVDNNTGGGSILASGGKKQEYVNTYDTGGQDQQQLAAHLIMEAKRKITQALVRPADLAQLRDQRVLLDMLRKKTLCLSGNLLKFLQGRNRIILLLIPVVMDKLLATVV